MTAADALAALEKLANIAFVNTSNEKHSVEEHVSLVETIRTALQAAPEVVTVDELRSEHMKHVQCYGDINVFDWQRIRYPNGLRIVKEK